MDPVLLLDASSEEEACWTAVAEGAHEQAVAFLQQAARIVRAYVLAAQSGRAEFVPCELAASLVVDERSATTLVHEALDLLALPDLVRAIEAGRLGLAHSRALLDEVRRLSPPDAATVVRDVLAGAAGRTPARVRDAARRAVLRLDPAAADRRRAEATAARGVRLRPADDGMAVLELHLRAELALAVMARADAAALAGDDSGRSAEQRRVDWITDSLLAAPVPPAPAAPAGTAEVGSAGRLRRPAQILVTMPVQVALGLSDEPCELTRYGPITADHGRELLADAELRKVCLDAVSGQVVHVEPAVRRPDPAGAHRRPVPDVDREQALAEAVRRTVVEMVLTPAVQPVDAEPGYRPSAALRRTVAWRDLTCDFPTCSVPADRCDADHTVPWPAGPTEAGNLSARSRRHHRAKQAGWNPSPLPDGATLWHAPSGRTYTRPAPRARARPPGPLPALPPPAPPPRRVVPPPPLAGDPARSGRTPGDTTPAQRGHAPGRAAVLSPAPPALSRWRGSRRPAGPRARPASGSSPPAATRPCRRSAGP